MYQPRVGQPLKNLSQMSLGDPQGLGHVPGVEPASRRGQKSHAVHAERNGLRYGDNAAQHKNQKMETLFFCRIMVLLQSIGYRHNKDRIPSNGIMANKFELPLGEGNSLAEFEDIV